MINRILIRVKVIQILYSFLLIEKRFSLEGNPTSPTKEKRFAYALYLELLVLLIKVADSIERSRKDFPLADTRFISRLKIDETVRSLIKKYYQEEYPLQPALESVIEDVKNSGIYKNFLKDSSKSESSADDNVWQELFRHVIITNPALLRLIETRKDYTPKALERTKDMINRTFVNFLASQDNIKEVEQALRTSLDKARELYMRLLYLPVELTDLEERILDDNRHKFLKTEEDINPDMRFVENRMVAELRNNPELEAYISKNKLSWLADEPVMMRNILKTIKNSDAYRYYMNLPASNMKEDAELWRSLFKNVILNNEEFLENLEEKSVFWNDDLEILSTFVLKSFRRIEEGGSAKAVLDKFKDEEDERFGEELIRYVYRDKDTLRLYIEEVLEGGNWERERLAFMDLVIIETALAEIINFPKIPLKASLNEYIEIAKSYSSARSGQFVNGIIGSVVSRLNRDGKLLKK